MADGIPAWAVKGAKVVCIDDSLLEGIIAKGPVYTVASAEIDPWIATSGPNAGRRGPVLHIEEVHNPMAKGGAFAASRFRPAVPPRSLEQDVARFRKHLRTKRASTVTRIPHLGEVS